MEEERNQIRRRNRSVAQKCCVLFIRIPINIIILALLGAAAYLIYYTTIQTTEVGMW